MAQGRRDAEATRTHLLSSLSIVHLSEGDRVMSLLRAAVSRASVGPFYSRGHRGSRLAGTCTGAWGSYWGLGNGWTSAQVFWILQ